MNKLMLLVMLLIAVSVCFAEDILMDAIPRILQRERKNNTAWE